MIPENVLVLGVIALAVITAILLVAMGEIGHRNSMSLEERLGKNAKSYWNTRLMKEGVRPCAYCGEAFRPERDDLSSCEICTPDWEKEETVVIASLTAVRRESHQGFRPAYMDNPDLYREE